jgi:hypothetical protein
MSHRQAYCRTPPTTNLPTLATSCLTGSSNPTMALPSHPTCDLRPIGSMVVVVVVVFVVVVIVIVVVVVFVGVVVVVVVVVFVVVGVVLNSR